MDGPSRQETVHWSGREEEEIGTERQADEQAYRCMDHHQKESWQRIALSYRESVQPRLDTGATSE